MTRVGSRQVLLIDDNADDCALVSFVLTRELPDIEIVRPADEESLSAILGEHHVVAVVTEYRLIWTDGFRALDVVRRLLPDCPVFMFTGSGDEELVRRALKGGFADYVPKSSRGYVCLAQRILAFLRSPQSTRQESEVPDQPSRTDQSIELLHAVSHDLQEPLRGVSRFSRILEEKLKEADPDTKRFLRHVVEASDRMRAMLDDYLEYLNVGKHKDPDEHAELEEALDSAMGNLRLAIQDSGAVIKRGSLPVVAAGFNDMVRLFQNLLDNALKFRSEASPQLEVAVQRLQGAWLLSVKDNGIGIDKGDFRRVFQMHRRLHPATQFPGNGMGLAICRRIVEEYGGRIWVDSKPGAGSTFYVTLPAFEESTFEDNLGTARKK